MEKVEIKKEEPCEVLKFFREISNIPRKSGNEREIRDYLIKFALDRNLECYTDQYFNVIIRKKASIGYEDYDYLALQAHTDMICEKEQGSKHNFEKDPIELIKDGDFIKAKGTTLGADNGIGVALMLALLNSKDIKTPKMECIFTVQEETTMIGAKLIDVKEVKSKRMISLDNGKEGNMVISSANCMEWFGKIEKEYIEIEDMNVYELSYQNFPGGHSGGNIADVKRGNPIKLGIDILSKLDNVYINKISGGSAVNIIPRDFTIQFCCKDTIEKFVNEEIRNQKKYYGNEVVIELNKIVKIPKNQKVLSKNISQRLINFINLYVNGALNFDENGNQILSANFGAINEFDDFIRLEYSLRSNDKTLKEEYLKNLQNITNDNDIEILWNQELKGFNPDYTSSLVIKTDEIYKNIFKKEMKKNITQGVLEGGFFKDRIKDLEYICIGAQLYDAHSPTERVSISSLQRFWSMLKQLVQIRF